jgi:hypothetical protein
MQVKINHIVSVLTDVTRNDSIVSNCFVLESPVKLPVVLVTVSSKDIDAPPSLCFGIGVGCTLNDALDGAIKELRFSASNFVKAVTIFNGFLDRKFTGTVESITDRMHFYATSAPRSRLMFLDREHPMGEAVYEPLESPGLDGLVWRFKQSGVDIYGLDCTPESFRGTGVCVTRAFSTGLFPMQFSGERDFNLPAGKWSSCRELPHFFL